MTDIQGVGENSGNIKQQAPSLSLGLENKLHIAWAEEATGSEIKYALFQDNQSIFERGFQADTITNGQPDISCNGDNVFIVWEGYENYTDSEIFFASYVNDIWYDPYCISGENNSKTLFNSQVISNESGVYVVWMEMNKSNNNLYFRGYDFNNWGPIVKINSLENNLYPKLTFLNSELHIFWAEKNNDSFRIAFKKNNGLNWSDTSRFLLESEPTNINGLSVWSSGEKVHIVWSERVDIDSDYGIYITEFDGTNFSCPIQLSNDDNPGHNLDPCISGKNQNVSVVWRINYNYKSNIVYCSFTNGEWSDIEKISGGRNEMGQYNPTIEFADFYVNIMWEDYDETYPTISYLRIEYYPVPTINSVCIQGLQDKDHITDHSPIINWTYNSPYLTQVGYNVSVWQSEKFLSKLMWSINVSSNVEEVQYQGNELKDGQRYYLYIQVFNGYRWSNWAINTFRMNSPPSIPISPNLNDSTYYLENIINTHLLWENSDDEENDIIEYHVFQGLNENPPQNHTIVDTNFTSLIPFDSQGTFYWIVCAFDGYEWSNGSLWSFIVIEYSDPIISHGIVNPTTGDQFTNYTFSFLYVDKDNDIPKFVYLIVDGIKYEMNENDSEDTNFTDGKEYYKVISLNNSNHEYYFQIIDQNDDEFQSDAMYGPLVQNEDTGIDDVTISNIPEVVKVGENIEFTVDLHGLNESEFDYIWYINETAEEFNQKDFNYMFNQIGVYHIGLTVFDKHNNTKQLSLQITVIEESKDPHFDIRSILPYIAISAIIIIIIISVIMIISYKRKSNNGEYNKEE